MITRALRMALEILEHVDERDQVAGMAASKSWAKEASHARIRCTQSSRSGWLV
jgi:hypothetical protein